MDASSLSSPDQALVQFPLQTTRTPVGVVSHRQTRSMPGAGRTLVLLHGIGSASASWVRQLQAAQNTGEVHLLAWDAPGYGQSDPVLPDRPLATDYALRLWQWLDTQGVQIPVTLVGHSLGAIMAASAARLSPARVQSLVLLSPARGYGPSEAAERERKLSDRLALLRSLGPEGMARERGAAMLSPQASAEDVAFIQSVMAGIHPTGYTQAAHLLAGADLLADLANLQMPIAVASGNADTITPPAACQAVAAAARTAWQDLGPVGHACPLEAARAVNQLLDLPALPQGSAAP